MAPGKKKEQQKMSLGDFLTDTGFGGGSWADEVEEAYVVTGTQPLPPADRPRYGGGSGGMSSTWQDRGFSSIRENLPQVFPDKPPYTAHLGNLSYDATNETVTEFFGGCNIASIRIIEDREMQRPKGFGYVEFVDPESLKKALTLDSQSFQGRMIKIKIADPPRGGDSGRGDSIRELSDWTRKGPLPDVPSRGPPREFRDERRPPRDSAAETRPPREMTWERRGPLAPLSPQEGGPGSRDGSRPPRPAPEGMGERSERGSRNKAPAWGEGRPEGARPPRPDRPERVPTAAEKDNQWRTNMRPDPPTASSSPAQEPTSPVTPAAPVGRPKLNLAKRTVSEAPEATTTSAGSEAKPSPFGAARPINTAAREKEIEEKRQQQIVEKREQEEKQKEEKRLAKEAAAQAEAEAQAQEKAQAEAQAQAKAQAEAEAEAKVKAQEKAADGTEEATETAAKTAAEPVEKENGEQATAGRGAREPRGAAKSRASEAGNWRSAGDRPRGAPSGPRGSGRGGASRGGRNVGRQPRANGPGQPHTPATEEPTVDEDGWTTVKKGRAGRPVVS